MKKLLQFLLVLAFVSVLPAQDTSARKDSAEAPRSPIRKFYKVSFLIYELEDGKKINARNYTIPVFAENGIAHNSSIRVGTRVPTTVKDTQIQYLDVGLDIVCGVTEQADKFVVDTHLEISSFALPEQGADPRVGGSPVLRTLRQHFTTILNPGKPALVTVMDDVNSKKRLQVEVTATHLE